MGIEGEGREGGGRRKRHAGGAGRLFPLPSSPVPRRFPSVIGSAPPYALHPTRFPCRALAARAGRAALGGEREVALACWLAARLALGLLPPEAVPAPLREVRAAAARGWLANLE